MKSSKVGIILATTVVESGTVFDDVKNWFLKLF